MSCHVCGVAAEIDIHILFQCPLAQTVWENSDLSSSLWRDPCSSVWDQFFKARDLLDDDEVWGTFIATAWEIWNARNRCIFGEADIDILGLEGRHHIQ